MSSCCLVSTIQRTEELMRRRRRLCSEHPSVLDFREGGRREKRRMKKGKRKVLICPWRPGILSWQIVLATFWPRPRLIPAVLCSACLLSRNDIVNDNNTAAYRQVSAVTPAGWRRDGMANCHRGVSPPRTRAAPKIRRILRITG